MLLAVGCVRTDLDATAVGIEIMAALDDIKTPQCAENNCDRRGDAPKGPPFRLLSLVPLVRFLLLDLNFAHFA